MVRRMPAGRNSCRCSHLIGEMRAPNLTWHRQLRLRQEPKLLVTAAALLVINRSFGPHLLLLSLQKRERKTSLFVRGTSLICRHSHLSPRCRPKPIGRRSESWRLIVLLPQSFPCVIETI